MADIKRQKGWHLWPGLFQKPRAKKAALKLNVTVARLPCARGQGFALTPPPHAQHAEKPTAFVVSHLRQCFQLARLALGLALGTLIEVTSPLVFHPFPRHQ